MPSPNVDSAVIKLKIRTAPPISVADERAFFAFVKAAFGQRRKTVVNSLSSLGGYARDDIRTALSSNGIREDIRAEALGMEELASVFNELYRLREK